MKKKNLIFIIVLLILSVSFLASKITFDNKLISKLNNVEKSEELPIFSNSNGEIKLYPGGNLVGIYLDTQGAVVVDYEQILSTDSKLYSPAKDAKILPGDVITAIDNRKIENAKDVLAYLEEISQRNSKVIFKVSREGKIKEFEVIPIKSKGDGKYRVGLWVRDNVAGIGTLTCVSSDKKYFAALGHSINDIDTGIIIPLKEGTLLKSELISVVKGEAKQPGELRGIFQNTLSNTLGTISVNDEYGIYGSLNSSVDLIYDKPMSIAYQDEIKEGAAKIIATIDENGPRTFDVVIEKVNKQTKRDTKSMLIKVTDEELLEKTGGIVQGMSGSPIIQNGKIVGAITHVFVNDPTKGYGIFIEWMIKDLTSNQN